MSLWLQRTQDQLEGILRLAPVVAVVTIDRAEDAVPLARALVAGGIPAIEVTLRTPAAIDATEMIAKEVEGAVVGVGTVLTAENLRSAERAGARFAVAPGASPALLQAAEQSAVPFLLGAATASEAMMFFERGFRLLKFFPAEPAGGVEYLKALSGPLPGIRFCPTGGVRPETAPAYLALPNVVCVGGSWLTPASLVKAADWNAITALARTAAALQRG
jgi:2-dehydro-3-deoxyphosphogluconate aldolase / (4S)-4-hydroxy-2-oxoglutarate aldolase